jgi:hypothetical protein
MKGKPNLLWRNLGFRNGEKLRGKTCDDITCREFETG